MDEILIAKELVRSLLLILIYVIAFVGSNLCFKKAGVMPVQTLAWWLWFALGNAVGFLGPVSITLALRGGSGGSVSWIFSLAIGLGFLGLQLSLWIFHGESWDWRQGSGVVLIAVGLILTQWGRIL